MTTLPPSIPSSYELTKAIKLDNSGVITGDMDIDYKAMLKSAVTAGAVAGVTTAIDIQMGYAKEVPLKDSAGNIVTNSGGNTIMTIVPTERMLGSGLGAYGLKASQEILHGLARSAITGEDIKTSLATSVGNAAFEYIGHDVYAKNPDFPIPKTVTHSLIGGTLAELAGGDFSQGAISTAVGHVVAEQIGSSFLDDAITDKITMEDAEARIKAIAGVVAGAVTLATHENVTDEELAISQSMTKSVVENNNIKAIKIAKAAYDKLKAVYAKKGKITTEDLKTNLKDVGKDEALSVIENVIELTNGIWTLDDVFAGVDLATGLDWKSKEGKAKIAAESKKIYDRVFQAKTFKNTAEAANKAKELGYSKINELSHGQAVFYNNKTKLYITRDIDGHNGGAWKAATSVEKLGSKVTRSGTYDADMNWIGK